jgi:hypothetical protein
VPLSLLDRPELADPGLELPGVERIGQLRQLTSNPEVLRIERGKGAGSRHIVHGSVLADRH